VGCAAGQGADPGPQRHSAGGGQGRLGGDGPQRRVIWSAYHVVCVPAIMGVHGTIASEPWIFMQATVSRKRTDLPRPVRSGLAAGCCRRSVWS